MHTKITRLIPLLGAIAAVSLPTFGAQPDAPVSSAQYEQLKQECDALQAKVDQLIQQQAAIEKVQKATPSASGAVLPASATVGAAAGDDTAFLLWKPSVIQPGWERIRAPGWMEPGRLNEMNARIAQGQDFQLFMGLQTAGRFQAIKQSDVYQNGQSVPDLTSGFQTAWGSMDFLATFNNNIEVYFDVYLSSMPHQDYLQGHEGYMLLRGLDGSLADNSLAQAIFNNVNIRAGQFDIDFGDQQYRRTDDARGQPNALIGNSVFDPSATEIGVEVMSKPQRYNWLLGAGSGTEEGNFHAGHNLSIHAKLSADLDPLHLSVSAYHLRNSMDSTASTNLFTANRSGGQYQGILDNGSAPGQVELDSGRQLDAFQADASWYKKGYELYGNVGWAHADSSLGTDEWVYYTAEGIYRFTPRIYMAARYSGGLNRELLGVSGGGAVSRYQFGGGYWLTKTILIKLEYVYQDYTGFKQANGEVSGVDAWRDPSFHGVISEVTFSY